MKLIDTHITHLDLRPHLEDLSPRERQVADLIADAIREDAVEGPMGLFIWRVCGRHGVNHRKIARHLGGRKKSRA